MDDVKSQMEGLTRVYIDLDNKISDKGGMPNLFGMNRKIRQARWNRSASVNLIPCSGKSIAPKKV